MIPLLHRQVVVFLCRIDHFFAGKLLKGADDTEAGVARLDDIVDVAVACGIVRIAEQVVVLLLLLLCNLRPFGRVFYGPYFP